MIKPTSKNINIIAIVISIIIYYVIISFYSLCADYKKMNFQVSITSDENQYNDSNTIAADDNSKQQDTKMEYIEPKKETKRNEIVQTQGDWTIEIPEINLKAEISEGTTPEIMDKYVGHFEDTKMEYGNIGLAAHNRGYPVNYFQDLRNLKEGSEIFYKHGDYIMTYIVTIIEIIENTNWDYLRNTEDNRITLITCVENEPKYRRCIQGIEKVESEEY